MYREQAWTQAIKKVEVDAEGKIHVYHAEPVSDPSVFVKFPSELFVSEEDKRAVLAHEAGAYATTGYKGGAFKLLVGMCYFLPRKATTETDMLSKLWLHFRAHHRPPPDGEPSHHLPTRRHSHPCCHPAPTHLARLPCEGQGICPGSEQCVMAQTGLVIHACCHTLEDLRAEPRRRRQRPQV